MILLAWPPTIRHVFPLTTHDRTRLAMSDPVAAAPNVSEFQINLAKDGGRRVMYGGDPYEDDVEPDQPSGVALGGGSAASGATP
jgi:hypothetical protein